MMERLARDRVAELMYEPPKRPIAETFTYQHILDWMELERLRDDKGFVRYLKRHMAHSLADMIIEKCQLFQMPEMYELARGTPIRMELTINDRGAYENIIPHERDVAKREGVKIGAERVEKSLPYGFELNQFYE